MKKSKFKRIKLGSNTHLGLSTKVDAADYEDLMQYSWYVHKESGAKDRPRYVAEARINGKYIKLHRYLLKAKKGQTVDHINRDPLDNRRANLRFVNRSQNRLNQDPFKNTISGHRGIYWLKRKKAWRALIKVNKKIHYIGQFKKLSDAKKAYKEYVTTNKKIKDYIAF